MWTEAARGKVPAPSQGVWGSWGLREGCGDGQGWGCDPHSSGLSGRADAGLAPPGGKFGYGGRRGRWGVWAGAPLSRSTGPTCHEAGEPVPSRHDSPSESTVRNTYTYKNNTPAAGAGPAAGRGPCRGPSCLPPPASGSWNGTCS